MQKEMSKTIVSKLPYCRLLYLIIPGNRISSARTMWIKAFEKGENGTFQGQEPKSPNTFVTET